MAWSDHVAEAAFKPVPGGFTFAAPSERLFGPPRFYHVNDGEKAELIAIRRASGERWQSLFTVVSGVVMALLVASAASFAFLGAMAGLACIAGAIVLMAAAVVAARMSKARAIAPALARLTPSADTISPREAFERQAEAIRQGWAAQSGAAGTPLGSWFEGWNAHGTSGLLQTAVTTQMRIDVRIESGLARGIYWLAVLVALGLCGLIAWVTVQSGFARDNLLLAPAGLAIAFGVYVLGWAWRWLWTGRTDHLFAVARHTPPGRLDGMRKNVTSLLALW